MGFFDGAGSSSVKKAHAIESPRYPQPAVPAVVLFPPSYTMKVLNLIR